MKTLIVLLLIGISFSSFAAESKFKIIQVIKNQHIVIAQGRAGGNLTPGQTFLVNFPGDEQCTVNFKSMQEQRYIFDTSSCDREDQLKKNLEIEQALIADEQIPATAPATQRDAAPEKSAAMPRFRFGLTAHYNTADEVEFNETIGNDVKFNTKGAFGFGVRGALIEEDSWGFIASLEHELKRKINSVSGGGAFSAFTNKPEVSFTLLEVAAVYRWGFFYLPFGLNYSVVSLSNAGGDDFNGTIGAMFGAGFFVHEHASFEINARAIGMYAENDADDDVLGTGFLTGLVLKANFWF